MKVGYFLSSEEYEPDELVGRPVLEASDLAAAFQEFLEEAGCTPS